MPWRCEYCGKDSFAGYPGLLQHLTTSTKKGCKAKHEEAVSLSISQQRQQAMEQARQVLEEETSGRVTRSRVRQAEAARIAALFAHDIDAARSTIIGADVVDADADSLEDEEEDSVGDVYDVYEGEDDDSVGIPVNEDGHHITLTPREEVDSDDESEAGFEPPDDVDDDEEELEENMEEAETNDEAPSDHPPDTSMLDEFLAYCDPRWFVAPLEPVHITGIKLMDTLRRKKAPLNAYKDVFEWHLKETGVINENEKANAAGDKYIGRETLMKRLTGRYNMRNKAPQEKLLRLPSSKEVVRIPYLKARDCILQLLTDPRITDDDYAYFNNDPLAPPPRGLDYVGDINTGQAFINTYDELIDQPNQQLLGVIFYIDGAATGQFADLPVTALKMTLTCFTRVARMKPHCWAILGYVPNVKKSEGRGKKILKESQHLEAEEMEIFAGEGEDEEGEDESLDSQGEEKAEKKEWTDIKAQDFHAILHVILERSGYLKLQETGFLWHPKYKGKIYPDIHYKLFTPIIKCDTEEGDMLCGKYKTRTKNVKHICRICHCPTCNADKYSVNYPHKTQEQIKKLVSKANLVKLQMISQHYLKNSWYDIRFNLGNARGIHGATPSEMLHAILLGDFKYVRDIFFSFVGDSAAVSHEINGLAKVYGKLFSHQSDRSFGSTNFGKGIREGKLMAKDYRGVLLNLAAVLRSTKGRQLLHTKRKFKKDSSKDDWLMLVETLLEWEAYLNQPTMKKKHVKRLQKKNRFLMYLMKKVAKRSEGMGLKIMKYHAILHMMEDILLYGVPLEFDTGANESHHKESKHAAKLTQRNEDTFTTQVAKRMFEFLVMELALEEVLNDARPWEYYHVEDSGDEEDSMGSNLGSDMEASVSDHSPVSASTESDLSISTDDSRIKVYFDEEEGVNSFQLLSKSKFADKTMMNIHLLDFLIELQDKVIEHIPEQFLQIYTRHRRGKEIFHGHPNYRGNGPWKDWVIVDWGQREGELCAHIQCFVVLAGLPSGRASIKHGGITLGDGVYAVIESSTFEEQDEDVRMSDLFVPILKEVGDMDADGIVTSRRFYLAPTDAFLYPACVVPDIGGPANRYFYVHPRTYWPNLYMKWLDRPHKDDAISDEELSDPSGSDEED